MARLLQAAAPFFASMAILASLQGRGIYSILPSMHAIALTLMRQEFKCFDRVILLKSEVVNPAQHAPGWCAAPPTVDGSSGEESFEPITIYGDRGWQLAGSLLHV
eukprot:6426375-Amphidinium_carterae.1